MEINYGDLIRKLREERNMTQVQLSMGISSRTTLSSFENGAKSIKNDILIAYLERLNVSLEEYQYLLTKNSENSKSKIKQIVFQALNKSNDPKLEKNLLEQYNKTGDFTYYYLYANYYFLTRF